jgi:hypothetical protein
MQPFVIEETVTVTGGGLKSRVTIPASDLKNEDGVKFIHMSTVPKWANRLFASETTKIERVLSRTDVVSKLTQMRNDKLTAILSETTNEPAERLAIFEGAKRMKVVDKTTIPASVTLTAPDIGPVLGCEVKVLMSWRLTAPLYAELSAQLLEYIRDACQWQLENANIKRTKIPKKHRAEELDAEAPYEEEEEEEEEKEEEEEEGSGNWWGDTADEEGGEGKHEECDEQSEECNEHSFDAEGEGRKVHDGDGQTTDKDGQRFDAEDGGRKAHDDDKQTLDKEEQREGKVADDTSATSRASRPYSPIFPSTATSSSGTSNSQRHITSYFGKRA